MGRRKGLKEVPNNPGGWWICSLSFLWPSVHRLWYICQSLSSYTLYVQITVDELYLNKTVWNVKDKYLETYRKRVIEEIVIFRQFKSNTRKKIPQYITDFPQLMMGL